jgi:hypothetical protein
MAYFLERARNHDAMFRIAEAKMATQKNATVVCA